MDVERARAFLREHHRGVLATARADRRPQMSAVSVAVDDAGRVAISTREAAYKVRHIRNDPRVSLFAMSDDFWSWIQVDGTATIVRLPTPWSPSSPTTGPSPGSTPTGTTTGGPCTSSSG